MNLIKELEEISLECNESDWDFEGALPLDKNLIEECKNFILWLPEKLEGGVVPFSNGSIGLDFYNAEDITTIVFEKEYIVWVRSVNKVVESGIYNKDIKFLNYFILVEILKMFL